MKSGHEAMYRIYHCYTSTGIRISAPIQANDTPARITASNLTWVFRHGRPPAWLVLAGSANSQRLGHRNHAAGGEFCNTSPAPPRFSIKYALLCVPGYPVGPGGYPGRGSIRHAIAPKSRHVK